MREPNFENLLKILRLEKPDRPTLFELFLNQPLYERLGGTSAMPGDSTAGLKKTVTAFQNAGYDYAALFGSSFWFTSGERETASSFSLNEGAVIHDRATFEAYDWPDPDAADYSHFEKIAPDLPDGMKLIVFGPCGILENVVSLVGYDALCTILLEDPDFAEDLFEAVGSRMARFYELCAGFDTVGALVGNDDWGFNTQTVLAPDAMRKYVFPWYKKVVEIAHAHGKPALLHSCGNLRAVMDDIVDDMGYSGKHSFEDNIQPIEDVYEEYHDRIAILGGIDVNFLCTATVDEIKHRSRAMLERSADRGAYALGSGNSIPEYVPDEAYFAMTSVVLDR